MSGRNVFYQPPVFLGEEYAGYSSWRDSDGFDDLAKDCYMTAVLKRIDQLKALLGQRPSVAGAIRQNMKFFLIDCQRKANRTGYKLFKNVEKIVQEAIDDGQLSAGVADGGKLRNGTVLQLGAGGTFDPVTRADLERLVDSSEVWLHVVRTIAGPEADARALLDAIKAFPGNGVAAVRLGDLIAVLRERVEAAEHFPVGSAASQNSDGIIRTILPDARYEEEESRRDRIRRIREKIDRLDRGADVKKRMLLLFDRLVTLNNGGGEIVWEKVFTEVGIKKSTFWEYINVLRTIVKQIENEERE